MYQWEDSTDFATTPEINSAVSYFDLQIDLLNSKMVFYRKIVSILQVAGEIGGFAAAVFDLLMIFFTAYSSANFKLEFVQQAFKTRKNDIDFNPEVFKKGYIFDDKMV